MGKISQIAVLNRCIHSSICCGLNFFFLVSNFQTGLTLILLYAVFNTIILDLVTGLKIVILILNHNIFNSESIHLSM